jgi:uncharacterized protein YjhX (UPF0386 family)
LEFAVRTKSDEFQFVGPDLAVNEDEVWADMTIAVVSPLPRKRVIATSQGQREILLQ